MNVYVPPISNDPEDATFMEKSESKLHKIRRQALDSPIIRLSMDIRNGKRIPYGKYGEGVFKINYDKLTDKIILSSDQMICGKNDTRRMLNAEYRALKGYDEDSMPYIGERIVGLNNLLSKGMYNGQTWEVLEDFSFYKSRSQSQRITMKIRDDVGKTRLVKCVFPEDLLFNEGMSSAKLAHYMKEKELYKVDFAYALTCHKMQGSSARKPILFEERLGNSEFHRKWMYTGVTRAVEKLIIVTE